MGSSRLLDKKLPDGSYPFRWVDSANTDIRRTFEAARRKLEQEKVAPMKRKV